MIKYRILVRIKSWLTDDRKKNTEIEEVDSFYFEDLAKALFKMKYIDMHREEYLGERNAEIDRKSTRLNSSHRL